jgi:hypothetical protein
VTGALAVISAAAALAPLPQLPARGLALETKAGVELQTLGGRPLVTVRGLDLAPDQAVAHRLVLRNRRGGLFALDVRGRRLRRRATRRHCRTTDIDLVVCAHVIKHGSRVVARAPAAIGHWLWAAWSPDRTAVLAQWSAECELPVAYLVVGGRLRAYANESVALGWLPSGAALIHFPNGPCAGWAHTRGIYAVARNGRERLVLRTKRFAQYAMWGG